MENHKLSQTQQEYLALVTKILSYPGTTKSLIAKWLKLSNSALTDRELKSDALLRIDIAILVQYEEALNIHYEDLKQREKIAEALAGMRY